MLVGRVCKIDFAFKKKSRGGGGSATPLYLLHFLILVTIGAYSYNSNTLMSLFL